MSMFDTSPRRKRAGSGQTSGAKGQYDRMYIAWVMDNTDAQRMGRLRVYIPEFGGDPYNEDNWVVVSYCSPFAGATNPWAADAQAVAGKVGDGQKKRKQGNVQDGQKHEETQQSYGMWFVPPDINNEVLVGFAAGDPTKGIWFGCLYQQHMNHMVPGIAKGASYQKSGCLDKNGNPVQDPPVSEYNRLVSNPTGADAVRRPEFKPLNLGLSLQGLACDTLRGVSTASARRESPSEVFGILTPKGSQFVMDDKDGEELIRLRTKSGTQIMLSESAGHVYMICKSGDAWFELNDDGYVDVYAAKAVSVHAETTVNIRGDQNINLDAGADINLKAKGSIRMEAGGNIDATAGGSHRVMAAGTASVKAGGDARVTAGGSVGVKAGGDLIQNGASIHLNGPAAPEAEAGDKPEVGSLVSNRKVKASVADRVPEHEPWRPHSVSMGGPAARPDATPSPGGGEPAEPAAAPTEDIPEQPPGECVSPSQLRTSDKGKLWMLKKEGYYSYVYPDAGGWAIGYGHNKKLPLSAFKSNWPNGLTEEEAYNLFCQDIAEFEKSVRSGVTGCMTQAQFDALVDLTYNLGHCPSSIKDLINKKDYQGAANKIREYNKSQGQYNAGLASRREEEATLFLKNVYPGGANREANKRNHISALERRWPRNLDRQNSQASDSQVKMAASAYQRMTGKALTGAGV